MSSKVQENIINAVEVVLNTYENIEKLMNACKRIASESKEYDLMTNKFLRYKSDKEHWGWMIYNFTLLFKKNDKSKNIIYAMQIDMNYACVLVAKFVYNYKVDYNSYISPGDYWKFFNPLWNEDETFTHEDKDDLTLVTPDPENNYLDLNYVIFDEIPLTDITNNNVKEKIFGTFNSLATK